MSIWNEKQQRLGLKILPCKQEFGCMLEDAVFCDKSFKLE